ncbi:MAG TPA: 50S ribosomal protein L4 [Negativicutes bacterium]|nr:50S ribosomal protein L4 [Negativicutes bacterium]
MKIPVYTQEGKEAGEVALPKDVFEVQMNADLVHQVMISYAANKRQVSAHTKNRGEVRGGGRKPWRQKGTGRARAGSTRGPIWKGGGVSGGPRNEKVYARAIPAKMRKKALAMVLSEKAKNNLLVVVDTLDMQSPKTKIMAAMIKKLPVASASRLVLYSSGKEIFLAARNIAKTGVAETRNMNVADLLKYKYVVLGKDIIAEIEKLVSTK